MQCDLASCPQIRSHGLEKPLGFCLSFPSIVPFDVEFPLKEEFCPPLSWTHIRALMTDGHQDVQAVHCSGKTQLMSSQHQHGVLHCTFVPIRAGWPLGPLPLLCTVTPWHNPGCTEFTGRVNTDHLHIIGKGSFGAEP